MMITGDSQVESAFDLISPVPQDIVLPDFHWCIHLNHNKGLNLSLETPYVDCCSV